MSRTDEMDAWVAHANHRFSCAVCQPLEEFEEFNPMWNVGQCPLALKLKQRWIKIILQEEYEAKDLDL